MNMRRVIFILLFSSGLAFGQGSNNFNKTELAKQVKVATLSNAIDAQKKLADRALALSGAAHELLETGSLTEASRNKVNAIYGTNIAARAESSPALAAAELQRVADSAMNDANLLTQVKQSIRSQTASNGINVLATFARGRSQLAIAPSAGEKAHPGVDPAGTAGEALLGIMPKVYIRANGGPTVAYRGVGLLLHWDDQRDEYEPMCTGTLVRKDKLITAAHCFCPELPGQTQTAQTCQTASPLIQNAGGWIVFFQGSGIGTLSDVHVNPNFEISTGKTFADVAVATFLAPVDDVPPMSFPPSGANLTHSDVEVVGFGASSMRSGAGAAKTTETTLTPPGLKLWGQVKLTSCQSPFIQGANLCWTANAANGSGSSGICGGDSGGPMLETTPPIPRTPVTPYLIGVNSANLADCTSQSPSGDTDLSAPENAGFLKQEFPGDTQATQSSDESLDGSVLAQEPSVTLDSKGTWSSSITVPSATKSVIVSINGPAEANLALHVVDGAGRTACTAEGGIANYLPMMGLCRITKPASDTYQIRVTGGANWPFQVIAQGMSR